MCFIPSHVYFKIHFFSIAVRKGFGDGLSNKTVDPTSVEAILVESNVKLGKTRIIFRCIRQFFGRSLFLLEKKDAASSMTMHTHQRFVEVIA